MVKPSSEKKAASNNALNLVNSINTAKKKIAILRDSYEVLTPKYIRFRDFDNLLARYRNFFERAYVRLAVSESTEFIDFAADKFMLFSALSFSLRFIVIHKHLLKMSMFSPLGHNPRICIDSLMLIALTKTPAETIILDAALRHGYQKEYEEYKVSCL